MKKQLSIYLALCLLLVGLNACTPGEPAQTSTAAPESSVSASEQPASSAAPASSEGPVDSEEPEPEPAPQPDFTIEFDANDSGRDITNRALELYPYEEHGYVTYKVDRSNHYDWWMYTYRSSGWEEGIVFIDDMVNITDEKWEAYIDQIETDDLKRQTPHIYELVKYFGIDKVRFKERNDSNKDWLGQKIQNGEEGLLEGLSLIYTDEQIEAIYSDDKARINRAFVSDTSLYYEGKAYSWYYVVNWTVEELRETGIPKETLLEFADEVDRWNAVQIERIRGTQPERIEEWRQENQYRAENGESYTMEQIKEKINQM